jgi:hypothetical protein
VEHELFRDRRTFITDERFVADERGVGIDEIAAYGMGSELVRILSGGTVSNLMRLLMYTICPILMFVLELDRRTGLGAPVLYGLAFSIGVTLWIALELLGPKRETFVLTIFDLAGNRLRYVASDRDQVERAIYALEKALNQYHQRFPRVRMARRIEEAFRTAPKPS